MQRHLLLAVLACVAIVAVATVPAPVVAKSSSGACAGCTLIVGFVEQVQFATRLPLSDVVKVLCADLSPKVKVLEQLCALALDVVVPMISKDMAAGKTPDYTCQNTLPLCKDWPQCSLFKKWPPASFELGTPEYVQAFAARAAALNMSPLGVKMDTLTPERVARADAVLAAISRQSMTPNAVSFYDAILAMLQPPNPSPIPVVNHLPLIDFDGDRFSTIPTLRGTHWRGRDCNDLDGSVYPGRAKDTVGPSKDHNCNGIFGTEPGTGIPYETKFCSNSSLRGLINLGDSATAHFSVPPAWLTPQTVNNRTFDNLLPTVEDELDWPQCGAWTAWEKSENCPASVLPVNSLYQQLRERNLCMHRDYQNIGVNGGASDNMRPPDGIIVSMKARNVTDAPALVVYALIGNDVCGHHQDFDHMTKPADFEKYTLESLDYLDAHLAPGSYVLFVGLVDGRVLYDTMANLQHPIGAPYSAVYDYLNCLDTNPCWGWLNGNETARNMTTARAMQLNAVYPKIISEHTYKNFKMHYMYADMKEQVANWVAQGHQARELIEPIDGFHPSQTGNQLTSKMIMQKLQQEWPEVLGPINPWNSEIKRIFGDQGGH